MKNNKWNQYKFFHNFFSQIYKKAFLNSMYLNTKKINTAIKGMDGYSRTHDEKYKDQIQQVKDFLWIYKG